MLLLAVTFASDFFCVSKAAAVTQSIITFVRYATVVARSLCWLVMFPAIQDSCAADSVTVFVAYVSRYPREFCCWLH